MGITPRQDRTRRFGSRDEADQVRFGPLDLAHPSPPFDLCTAFRWPSSLAWWCKGLEDMEGARTPSNVTEAATGTRVARGDVVRRWRAQD